MAKVARQDRLDGSSGGGKQCSHLLKGKLLCTFQKEQDSASPISCL